MAPEIQRGEQYTTKSDLWSVGIIMFELLAGVPPFTGQNKMDLRRNIEIGKYGFPEGVRVSDVAKDLMQKLIAKDPA